MTELAGAPAGEPKATFSDLVKQAFIDPIRSVLIIDDQYPTWEQIFSDEGYDASDRNRWAPKSKILKVVTQFRKMSPALTVDIHDGRHNEEIGSYLHQSDLLVLDYQLEKNEPHGIRATEIIADLLKNNHFNLVMIHTAIGDLVDPFNTVLMSLLTPLSISDARAEEGQELIGALEDSGNERFVNVLEDLENALSATAYIALQRHVLNGGKPVEFLKSSVELARYRAIADEAGWNVNDRLRVMDWGMSLHNKKVASHEASPRDLRWSVPGNRRKAWIRTNGGFIAFADKKNTELLKILQAAIEDWRPSPSRLMSSRIRAEISKQGAGAEDSALSDKHAYWQYYQELRGAPLDASPLARKNRRKTLLESHTARHTERLLDLIGKKAVEFGLKVLETDPSEANPKTAGFSRHYAINTSVKAERDKARSHYNAHISTKQLSGWHLHPGHIFRTDQEMWVCLSPSCDLVPMQKTSVAVRDSSAASVKPFVAVRLTEKATYSGSEVNSNTLIFLKEGDAIKTYTVYPRGGEFGSPVWRLFMAADYGKFEIGEDRTAELNLSYLSGKGQKMQVVQIKARLFGQLRYEYALNLIQKLGVEFTRIGLDFSAPTE
ncbi:response regulator receiver domain [Rhizobium sp. CC-YZS058]|uniref:response regulator receiver domain n=1 Tax=Rhizobium sp. CC-YZS058 TaxID=3042153 RepID=UPI002B0588FC|nr:response regulator receiver domain [Rhizobium sp. CC-YZS058]MEA3536640.1 response regulator receiver domain [Rhizobium sp. CC-YZS058]